MPTFLDNSLAGLNRGWQQLYGQPAEGPAPSNLYGRPAATPVVAASPAATPVAANPAVGQPLSGEGSTAVARDPSEDQILGAYYAHLLGLPFIRSMAAEQSQNGGVPMAPQVTPTANNPEQGQTLSGNDGSDGSGAGLLSNNQTNNAGFFSWLQNLFSRAGGGPQYSATQNTPANFYSGGASGGGYETSAPGMGNYYVGASPGAGESGYIYPDQATATAAGDVGAGSGGDGGMGGMGGGASSAIGAIGSGISAIGKGISNTKATYTAPNIPLPQRAVFVPPNLAPNTNA